MKQNICAGSVGTPDAHSADREGLSVLVSSFDLRRPLEHFDRQYTAQISEHVSSGNTSTDSHNFKSCWRSRDAK